MYIFLKNNKIVECNTLLEVVNYFDIKITDKGEVFIDGKKDTISYEMDEFTKIEAYRDFVRNRLSKFHQIYNGIKL